MTNSDGATGYRLGRIEKDLDRLTEELRKFPSLEAYRERQEAINREFRDVKADLGKLEVDTGQRLTALRSKVDKLEEEWQKDVRATLQAQLDQRRANTRLVISTAISIAALVLTIIGLVVRG